MRTFLLLAALAALPPAALRADPVDANFRAELLSADTSFCARAAKDGVLRAFLGVATADTILLSQAGKGFAAVTSGYKDMPSTATLTWKPTQAAASRSGDLGYTWGRYEYRDHSADGKAVVETGNYVTIWKRQSDGSWKVVLDGGTPDPKAS
jgi:ketosteroid isomerase-like protein